MISLPIDQQIAEIQNLLRKNLNLVLTAAPGAGKTTRIPPALTELTDKQIWVLEPRRMAAVAAAHRIAEEQGWTVGEEIGYQVRFDAKTSTRTKIVFLTEALLARKFLQDPELKDCGLVILDEFHERSLQVDLALGLIKEAQMLSRPDLKILVMSATLELAPLQKYLDSAPSVSVPGRLFELEMQYSKSSQLMRTDHHFIERVFEAIREQVLGRPEGRDVLVFLPGLSEISRLQRALQEASWAAKLLVLPLSGSLALDDQLKALKPASQRKIILSTNVAESSVTVDGIDTVIDSGLARDIELHPRTGFERLELRRISKASAQQRAGRAARQFAGRCLKLWTKMDELSMPDYDLSEIHRRDLAETVLLLHQLGVSKASEFSWFEAPDNGKIANAEKFLQAIGALNNGKITPLGQKIARLPLPPRLGKLLLKAEEQGALEVGADLCALLQEKDLIRESSGTHDSHCDLTERWEALEAFRQNRGRGEVLSSAARTVDQVAQQLRKLFPKAKGLTHEDGFIRELLLEAYPDRLCRRRKKENLSALMIGGRGVVLSEKSSAQNSEFFLAIELMETGTNADSQVRKACGLTREEIQRKFSPQITKKSAVIFDEVLKSYYVEEWLDLKGLPLEDPRRRPAKAEEIAGLLPQILTQRWTEVLKLNEELRHWWERWLYFEQARKLEATFPAEKLREIFEQASLGHSKFEAVTELNLIYFFEIALDPALLHEFHESCPAKLQVPSGSQIRIHYHLDKNPHLEVRLQEVFGISQTPTVMKGKTPVTLHLLAPNYRPVQVTSDLSSFWDNTYAEVKRELKTRYPKHSWPEDPRTAPAQAKGRPKRS